MYEGWTEYVVLRPNSLGFIWNIKRFYDVYLLYYYFERKVKVQNHEFGWVRFQNRFFLIK